MNKILIILLSATSAGFAQTVKLTEGNISSLKDQVAVSIEFTYDSLAIGKPTDQGYIDTNPDPQQKERGKLNGQYDKARAEYQFQKAFTKQTGLKVNINAPYTLIFHTTSFNKAKSASVSGVLYVVETQHKTERIASVSITNAQVKSSIGEAYAKAGKEFGRFTKIRK